MGIMSLARPGNQQPISGQVQVISPSVGDVYRATRDASELNFQSYSRTKAQDQALSDRDALFEQRTGQKVKDAAGATYDDPVLRYARMDELITNGRKENPDIYNDIPTSEEVKQNSAKLARTAQSTADAVKAQAGGITSLTGSLGGEFVAGVKDPVNAAAMLIGGGEAKGFMGVAKASAQAGAVNAGAETILQPGVASWQNEIGNEYGFSEASEQVGMAFMFGSAVEGGTRAIGAGLGFTRQKLKDFRTKRGMETPPTTTDEVLPHLLNQESGNRQLNEDGTPVTSPKGATGAAQVMPETGPEAARLAGLPWDEERFKTDKEYNTALGRAYFDKQLNTYGSPEVALLAYNAGPGAVSDFMHGTNLTGKNAKGIKLGDPKAGEISPQEFVRQFPFKESREYADKIMGSVHSTTPDLAPYIAEAKTIKQTLTETPYIKSDTPADLQKALGYRPKSITQFIKEKGGISDDMGELAARDINARSLPGLLRKIKDTSTRDIENIEKPKQLDYLKESVFDAGYFPDRMDYNDISDSDLFDAIAGDIQGQKRYTGDDMERIAAATEGNGLIDSYDQMGITRDMEPEEIASMLHANDVPEAFAVHDNASRYFDAIASSPESQAWARSSYAHLAEYADGLATSPFWRDTPIDRERHMNNLSQADKAIRDGKKISSEQLDAEGMRPRFSRTAALSESPRESRVRAPVSSKEVADVLKPEEAKQFHDTQRRDFDQRVKNDPEAKLVTEEGKSITMRELADEIDDAVRQMDEIKTCGLG